ncbi:MAG: CarD family transcriptional regulator [Deltaproteobacteria bacterium]|nr:MAG: CarD family transcriptional regulator [Deltaproteobacteria bacterium]
MFQVGEKIVYPGHGIGEILSIESRTISGSSQNFYILKIIDSDMKVMVPVDNSHSVGLRKITPRGDVQKIYDILRDRTNIVEDTQTWNRRHREYTEKINSGSIFEIAEVLRDLYVLKLDKDLSFGEKKMLDTARSLLVKEIALATQEAETKILKEIKDIFC